MMSAEPFLPLPLVVVLATVAILCYVKFRHDHPPPHEIDWDGLDLDSLRTFTAELGAYLDRVEEIDKTIREVEASGGSADRLRQVVSGQWAEITDKAASAWLFDGEHDQEDWLRLLHGKRYRNLPPIVDLTAEIAHWHGQSKYGASLFPVGEGGHLLPRVQYTVSDERVRECKCEECGKSFLADLDTGALIGVEIEGEDIVFCGQRCRAKWLLDGNATGYNGNMEVWSEWTDPDDPKGLQVLRESFPCNR